MKKRKKAPIPVNKGHGLNGKIWNKCLRVGDIYNIYVYEFLYNIKKLNLIKN